MRYSPTVILDGRLPIIQFIRMQKEANPFFVKATIQVINPGVAEQRCTVLDAMHFIALVEQKFGEVSSVLSGDTGTHACLVMSFALLCL